MSWKERFLKKPQQQEINQMIANFEEKTGTELTVAIALASDPYPAAPLRFALYSATLLTMVGSYFIELPEDYMWSLVLFLLTLPMSVLGGFLSVKKWMLTDLEIDREVPQRALEVFHQHALQRTTHHHNVLIYLSLLEKRLILLVDQKIKDKIPTGELEHLAKNLETMLHLGQPRAGLEQVINRLQQTMLAHVSPDQLQASSNQLKDEILWLD
jgi:putative membrane protein